MTSTRIFNIYLTDDEIPASDMQLLIRQDMIRMSRAFTYYMRDSLFRRLTFSKDFFTNEEREILAENGLFNTYSASVKNDYLYRIQCAFCSFHYSGHAQFLQVLKVKFQHMKTSPLCNRIFETPNSAILDGNLPFTDIFNRLKLESIGERSFDTDGIWTGKPLRLFDISDIEEKHIDTFKCLVCAVNRRCVWTQCGHLTTCYKCFSDAMTKARCNYCNQDIKYYCRAILPNKLLTVKKTPKKRLQYVDADYERYLSIGI